METIANKVILTSSQIGPLLFLFSATWKKYIVKGPSRYSELQLEEISNVILSNSFPNMGTYTLSEGRVFRPTSHFVMCSYVSYHLYHTYSAQWVFAYILLTE